MPTTALETVEAAIGVPPGSHLDFLEASTHRRNLESWCQLHGISAKSTRAAQIASLVKAYEIPAYLAKWRANELQKNGGAKPLAINWDEAQAEAQSDPVEPKGRVEAEPVADGVITASAEAIARAAESVISARLVALKRELDAGLDAKLADAKLTLTEKAKDEIRSIARDAARAVAEELAPPRRIEVSDPTHAVVRDLGLQHERFPLLLRAMSARGHRGQRLNIWLTGPTGSGKTSACESAAKALGLDFGADSSLDTDYKVTGFVDAHGAVVSTQFIKCYTSASVYVADEIDNWHPSALIALNAALANGWMATPAGLVTRHQDAVIVACANTWGLGATNDYVGRAKLDAASLDRFRPKIDWPYDERLELALASELGGQEWCRCVQSARASAKRQGLQVIISPRATYDGIGLLAAGFEWAEVVEMALTAGLKPEQIKSLNICSPVVPSSQSNEPEEKRLQHAVNYGASAANFAHARLAQLLNDSLAAD